MAHFPGFFLARPKSGLRELAPLAFARASSTQAMIGCSKQRFTLVLEKEKKEENRAHERGKLHAPPPGGHSSGWCLRKRYGSFKLFNLGTLLMGS